MIREDPEVNPGRVRTGVNSKEHEGKGSDGRETKQYNMILGQIESTPTRKTTRATTETKKGRNPGE